MEYLNDNIKVWNEEKQMPKSMDESFVVVDSLPGNIKKRQEMEAKINFERMKPLIEKLIKDIVDKIIKEMNIPKVGHINGNYFYPIPIAQQGAWNLMAGT